METSVAGDELKFPPPGVETSPSREEDVVSLPTAARVLGLDPQRVRRSVIKGQIRGGARPSPQRLQWYVYRDELDRYPATESEGAGSDGHRRAPSSLAEVDAETVADLRAQLAAQIEVNRLLLASEAEVLAAAARYSEGLERYRAVFEAAEDFRAAADHFRNAVETHRDALAQFTTPGHIGGLE
jgi:hypothetical protein